ncbi:hypothetical protein ABFS83_02G103600 [Erythranthe nasuta]
MKRHCNLSFPVLRSNVTTASLVGHRSQLVTTRSNGITLTSSYSDATELQAIAVLWVARRETEEKYNAMRSRNAGSISLHHGNGGLSLKKSLQIFLQKRKDRIQASMPY